MIIFIFDMIKDEIIVWIVDMLYEMFELDKVVIMFQFNFYIDFDIDSIDVVDIVVKFNQIIGKCIQFDVFCSVCIVQDVVEILVNLMCE